MNLIENIQIILDILFEYKKLILCIFCLFGTIFAIFFNIFIRRNYIKKINKYTEKKN